MEGKDGTKAKGHSPAVLKEIQALAEAEKRNRDGKATAEDFRALANASPSLRREARQAAGISSPRGKRSDVSVYVNGKNGNSVGWQEFYGLKALADELGETVEIRFVPVGNENAKPVPHAKVEALLTLLKSEREKSEGGMAPKACAQKVASGK